MNAFLDFEDPEEIRAWLSRLESLALDLAAAGEDATRAPSQRDLGRRSARAIIDESAAGIDSLIAYARDSIPTPHGDPSGFGGAGPH